MKDKYMKVIGIGETVLDIIFKDDIPQTAIPGGSAFNAIISLGRAKIPCTIVTQAGDDHIGDITCKYLRANGVDDSYVNRNAGVRSHLALAFLNQQNDAQYLFYKDHASTVITTPCPEFAKGDVVLFGSYFAVNPVVHDYVRSMLVKAADAGSFLYYDINFRASHISDIPHIMDNINSNMSLSSVVRGSLEDFHYLYGTNDVNLVYDRYIRPYCEYFICTNGAESIHLFTPHFRLTIPVAPIETVSTVGAGDNFNAGFTYALMKDGRAEHPSRFSEDDWQRFIAYGQLFSSDVCQQLGNSISEKVVTQLNKNK